MRSLRTLAAAGIAAAGVGGFVLPVQPAQAQDLWPIHVWATNVNARAGDGHACNDFPSVGNCPIIVEVIQPSDRAAYCQKKGQWISSNGYSSEWWSFVKTRGRTSWVSNVFINGNAHLDNVPDCTF